VGSIRAGDIVADDRSLVDQYVGLNLDAAAKPCRLVAGDGAVMDSGLQGSGESSEGEESHDTATLALLGADDLGGVVVHHVALAHHHVHVVAQGNSTAGAGRRVVDGRVVLDGAVGDGGESVIVVGQEVEGDEPAAAALKRGAVLKDHVGQREVGIAAGA